MGFLSFSSLQNVFSFLVWLFTLSPINYEKNIPKQTKEKKIVHFFEISGCCYIIHI